MEDIKLIKILHITHTNIKSDSRILKELNSISKLKKLEIEGIGINREAGFQSKIVLNHNVNLFNIKIPTVIKNFPFSIVKYFFTLIYVTIQIVRFTRKKKYRIIHCHDINFLLIAFLLKKIKGAELIYDAHELESNQSGKSNLILKIIYFLEKKLWKKIDFFITVSDSIFDWYNLNFGNKTGIVILNSPSVKNLKKTLNDSFDHNYLRNTFKIDVLSKIYIYNGLLTEGRGIEKLIDIFKSIHLTSHIVFIGYGDLKNLIKNESSTNKNIHYHDPVDFNEIIAITRSADIGICLIEKTSLSYYYCLPNKFFEYCFAGIPVLASNFPELIKFIDKYDLGYYCKPKSNAIIKKIVEIEKNPLHQLDNKKLIEHTSWENQEIKLNNLYKRILKT
jgi:glycosyltransferase involved in cell wall biosynthesis